MSDLINDRSLMEPQFPGAKVSWDAWEMAFGKSQDDYLKATKKTSGDSEDNTQKTPAP